MITIAEDIQVRILRREDVTYQVTDDINELLKQQHSQSRECDRSDILHFINSTSIAVAIQDERVVGMGVLQYFNLLAHYPATIRSLVVKKGMDTPELRLHIVQKLRKLMHAGRNCDIHLLPDDPLIPLLADLGFEKNPKVIYRLKT